MKIINEQLLDETQAKALQSPRLRMNYNFHEKLDDPINRLLNAMEPGTQYGLTATYAPWSPCP